MESRKQRLCKNMNSYKSNEVFRVLRTNLYFLEEKKSRIILITSSIPKEGKSTVALNYATSLTKAGEKVLLVDCSIRKPRIYEGVKVVFDKGLESVLIKKLKVEDIILRNVEKNLDILPTKNVTDDMVELFFRENIEGILQDVKEKYDTIILDTPSIIISTDAVILSKYCDGIVYVVGYNEVTRKELEFGKKILNNARANIYGFVVNKINKNGIYYGNYGCYNKDYYSEKSRILKKILKILR